MKYKVFETGMVDSQTGVISDETISLTDLFTAKKFPDVLPLVFSNVIGQVLFERTPLNELFDKAIINQNLENDRQHSLWWNLTGQ